mgnify:FL=1
MWWLILKAIVSSVVGSTFYQWFKKTKVGVWFQDKVDDFMEYIAEKYDIEIAKREEKWLSQYPNLAKRIELLEDKAHYKCGLEDFDGFEELDKRLTELENKDS